jgi:hypothetical protein
MPTKCSFCSERGHTIRHCNSNEGILLVDSMKRKADECIETDMNNFNRALLFYDFLKRHNKKELKIMLIILKRQNLISQNNFYGTRKSELASKIVYDYLYYRFREIIDSFILRDDSMQIQLEINFWRKIARGLINEVSEISFNNYLFNPRFYKNNNIVKFKIQIELNNIYDLTQEKFDCSICMDDECCPEDKVTINCKHSFCKNCAIQVLNDARSKNKNPCCALCRNEYSKIQVNNESIIKNLKEFIY